MSNMSNGGFAWIALSCLLVTVSGWSSSGHWPSPIQQKQSQQSQQRQQRQVHFILLPFLSQPRHVTTLPLFTRHAIVLYSHNNNNDKNKNDNNDNKKKSSNEKDDTERTTFDQAGRSLMDEEDRQRMEQMGDYDLNPSYQTDSIEQMRQAIRARTAAMGIEKSQETLEYIQSRQRAAQNAGSVQAANELDNSDSFGGLDLSKISTVAKETQWNEDLPTMFYDPEDELSVEEQEQVDPLLKAGWFEQFVSELKFAKWPDWASALREVGIIIVVIVFTSVLLIGWDKLLRELYTSWGFIPTKDDIANYAKRFDSLDLPSGWTNNMNDQDVATLSDTVQQVGKTVKNSLPDL